jgi:Flp pilus assembly pilin Flp
MNTRAQLLCEYALIAGLVAIAILAIAPGTSDQITAVCRQLGHKLLGITGSQ